MTANSPRILIVDDDPVLLKLLKMRLQAAGLPTDQPNAIPFTGRTRPLLAVFDPPSLKFIAMLRPN